MYRKCIILLVCFLISYTSESQSSEEILVKVGSAPVSVGEFKYIYEKNNGTAADYSEKSLNEYLDLYTKFKLKVEKAKQMQLDTISELITELAGYRKQLASSYLIDKEVTDELLKELYSRMKYDIEFSHIFIPVAENATISQKEDAKLRLREIQAKVIAGMDFAKAAIEFSGDKNSGPSGGYMGYFTAKLPTGFYNVESALYETPIGTVSDIVESKIGYHLIKPLQKRPARGQIEVAHILFKAEDKIIADTAYLMLKQGKSFEDAVVVHSMDRSSSQNKGLLPVFGINTYDKNFEDAAFLLSKDGDLTEPILTRSGWHIIKRISKPTVDTYDIFVRKMKSQINKDQRFEIAKIKLISDIQKSAGFIEYPAVLKDFSSTLNDEFYSYKWTAELKNPETTLVGLGANQKYTVQDFADYCKKNTRTRLKYDKSKPLSEIVDELYKDFTNEITMDFEEKNLDAKYPDFKSLMREYEEGILLFEATKISVWDRANQDTIGLMSFFEKNNDRYMWEEKATVEYYLVHSTDKKTIDKIIKYASKNNSTKTLKKFNGKNTLVEIATGEAEQKSKEMDGVVWKEKQISKIEYTDNHTQFIKIDKLTPPKNKTLAEARGYAVADYQDFLEKQWLESLKKEFPIQIYNEILNKLVKKS